MSTPEIGLSKDSLNGVITLLNDALADQHVLYIKLRNYHWNVTGPRFYMLHELFEDQYNQIAAAIDETAERVRAMGGRPLS
ncbi:MAG: DNA starvation/stationary phase protection protein, partial [Anaerolineae bacterium]